MLAFIGGPPGTIWIRGRMWAGSCLKPESRLFQFLFTLLVGLAAGWPAAAAGAGVHVFPDLGDGSDSKDFTISVLANGTEMEYSGRVGFGASAALRSALNANPRVTVLHLNSNGGSVGDARQLQYLIRDRGLTTVVDSHCLSACALVFLGGQERYLAPGAKLGFHREKAVGASPAEVNMFEETDAQFMLALGISSSFVDRAFSTPSSAMWVPTVDELKAAHVIADVSTKCETPDDARIAPNLAEQLLDENPLKALHARNPDGYNALRDRVVLAMRDRASRPDVEPLPTADIAPLSFVYLSHASDALAVEFTQAFDAYLVKVGKKNPDECYFILYPARAPAGFGASEVLAGDELVDFTDLQARLVGDGARRNAAVPSQKDIAATLGAVTHQVRQKNPGMASALSNMDSPTADHGTACSAMTEMLAAILALPDAQKGPLLRYLFAPT